MDFRTTGKMSFYSYTVKIILKLTSPASRKRRNTAGVLIAAADHSAAVFHFLLGQLSLFLAAGETYPQTISGENREKL